MMHLVRLKQPLHANAGDTLIITDTDECLVAPPQTQAEPQAQAQEQPQPKPEPELKPKRQLRPDAPLPPPPTPEEKKKKKRKSRKGGPSLREGILLHFMGPDGEWQENLKARQIGGAVNDDNDVGSSLDSLRRSGFMVGVQVSDRGYNYSLTPKGKKQALSIARKFGRVWPPQPKPKPNGAVQGELDIDKRVEAELGIH